MTRADIDPLSDALAHLQAPESRQSHEARVRARCGAVLAARRARFDTSSRPLRAADLLAAGSAALYLLAAAAEAVQLLAASG